MNRSILRGAVVLTLLAPPAFPSHGRAAGQPVTGYAQPTVSLRSAGGTHRYAARMESRGTVVTATSAAGTLSRRIAGHFAITMVAFDGSVGGLSADGHTLVLAKIRTAFPMRSSAFDVLDTDTLRVLRTIRLRGDFVFDAISPSGRWIYLIEYLRTSALQYRVRALDARSGRLRSRDIVDPRDREQMQGIPLSRVSSADGRWAYTVYDVPGARPFIHALDTAGLTARCIDLPAFPRSVNQYGARLRLRGHRLDVVFGRRAVSSLDVRSLRLLAPLPPRAPTRTATSSTHGGVVLGAAVALVLLAAGALAVRAGARAKSPAGRSVGSSSGTSS